MSGPVNNSPGSIREHQLFKEIVDKTREAGLDPKAMIDQAEQATAKFAKVAARQASEDANQPKTTGGTPRDPSAPELKQPVPNAVKDALKDGAQLQRRDAQKTDNTRSDNAPKQQHVAKEMTARNTPESMAARSQAPQVQMKTQSAREMQDPATLSADPGNTLAEDAADNNQMTKFVSRDTKTSQNQNTSRNERNPGQQPKALAQDAGIKDSHRLATDAQTATHVAQGSAAKSAVDEANKLEDVDAEMPTLAADSAADETGSSSSSLSGKAAAMMFFNMVMETVNKNSIENMMSSMNALLANDAAASEDFKNQYDAVSGLQAENDALGQQLKEAQSTLTDLKAASKAAADAAAANPSDAALQKKAEEAAAAVVAQQKIVTGLGAKYAENSQKISTANEKFYKDLSAYNATHHNMKTALLQQQYTNGLSNKASAELAMLEMLILMDENALEAANAMVQKKKLIQQAEVAAAEKAMNEAIENKRKADAMGCIAKLIAAIVTIVSFAAALFTGGASLVFASIAMAVLVVDTALQLAGKKTLTDMFMEKAIKPLMELLAKGLEGMGLSKDIAQGLAMALMAVALIIVMVVSMGAAGSALGSIAGPLGKAASQAMINNIASLARIAQATGAVLAASAQIGGAVYNAALQKNIAAADYANNMVKALFEAIKKDKTLEHMKEVIRYIAENMMTAIESQGQAGKGILKMGIKS